MGIIRTGLVGFGLIGRVHASIVRQHASTELVGVVEPRTDIAAGSAADLGGVPHFPTVTELISSAHPTLVIVATPPAAHASIVTELFSHGIHVLCEKPLTLDALDGRALVAAEAESSAIGVVNLQLRYDRIIRRLRELVHAGAIGRPLCADVRVSVTGALDASWGWAYDAAQGGGVTMEYGTHYLDLLRWIFGPLEVTGSRTSTLVTTRTAADASSQPVSADDWAIATLEDAHAMPISMTVMPGWDRRPRRELVVVGDQGSISAGVGSLELRTPDGAVELLTPPGYDTADWVAQSARALFDDVVTYLSAAADGHQTTTASTPPEWACLTDAVEVQVLVDQIRSGARSLP